MPISSSLGAAQPFWGRWVLMRFATAKTVTHPTQIRLWSARLQMHFFLCSENQLFFFKQRLFLFVPRQIEFICVCTLRRENVAGCRGARLQIKFACAHRSDGSSSTMHPSHVKWWENSISVACSNYLRSEWLKQCISSRVECCTFRELCVCMQLARASGRFCFNQGSIGERAKADWQSFTSPQDCNVSWYFLNYFWKLQLV